jgi:hypothetical protein
MASRKDERDAAGQTEETMAAGARSARRGAAETVDFAREQSERVRDLMGASSRVYSDMASDGPDVGALMQSSAKIARGMQDVGWEVMQYTQESLRRSFKTANDMMACRSVEDMVQIQQDFMRESMDTFLHESARILEMSSSMASDALGPVGNGRER